MDAQDPMVKCKNPTGKVPGEDSTGKVPGEDSSLKHREGRRNSCSADIESRHELSSIRRNQPGRGRLSLQAERDVLLAEAALKRRAVRTDEDRENAKSLIVMVDQATEVVNDSLKIFPQIFDCEKRKECIKRYLLHTTEGAKPVDVVIKKIEKVEHDEEKCTRIIHMELCDALRSYYQSLRAAVADEKRTAMELITECDVATKLIGDALGKLDTSAFLEKERNDFKVKMCPQNEK